VNINHLRTSVRQKRDEGLATITLMLDDVDSMVIGCELYRTKARCSSKATARRRPSSQAVAAVEGHGSKTLIGTTTTQAGHEPANELAVLTVTGLASTILTISSVATRRSASTDAPIGGIDMVRMTR
jgi:hypothetical protein